MQTSLALARPPLRHGWRSLVGIVVLVALIGGLVFAGLAGAQRTRTAVDRMIEQNEVSDVTINPEVGDESELDYDLVADGRRVLPHTQRCQLPSGEIRFDNMLTTPFTFATCDGARREDRLPEPGGHPREGAAGDRACRDGSAPPACEGVAR